MGRKTLGIDIGSSSVKVSLLDIESGAAVASATCPSQEMPIKALRSGWAEQDPDMWWNYLLEAIGTISAHHSMADVAAIGVSYQMHGLVMLDKDGKPVRDAIIWCDSRAVEIGAEAMDNLGHNRCLTSLLNSPGNFTASKLAWVVRNEPELFERTTTFMLPGDYIVYRLSGQRQTTEGGLSEQILWNFKENKVADFVADYYNIPLSLIPETKPALGIQAHTSAATEELLGIPEGTPISYRAGDQPNNAFSLGVMEAGEIAATGGTSGVVYGVTATPEADMLSRVNTFLHVNHSKENPHYGVLLCINGTGILNSWARRMVAPSMSYEEINTLASTAPVGSDGLILFPFGNGAERMLGNREVGASIENINLNRHSAAHILRAAQEGIAYSFRYGIDIMREIGLKPSLIRAGRANMFLSPLFCTTLASLTGARIELFNTDGALGAARGAALGAGLYKNHKEAFEGLKRECVIEPDRRLAAKLEEGYAKWLKELKRKLE